MTDEDADRLSEGAAHQLLAAITSVTTETANRRPEQGVGMTPALLE